MSRQLPRYPVYVPTRGRYRQADALTIRFLQRDEVPFYIVVEADEVEPYSALVEPEQILTLPPHEGRGVIFARNWIKDHATAAGAERHWQLDDNMREVKRVYRGRRIPCDAGLAMSVCEDLSDRYTNVAITGLSYEMFALGYKRPFSRNVHVYSYTLVNNAIPHRWRGTYNEDTDICLQVLADEWCTILLHAYCVHKLTTMTVKGGNSADLYQGDGRLKMARSLERLWPGVVSVDRRYGRPQHVVNWTKFDTPLKLKPDVDLAQLSKRNEYGMDLQEVKPVQSEAVRQVRDRFYA